MSNLINLIKLSWGKKVHTLLFILIMLASDDIFLAFYSINKYVHKSCRSTLVLTNYNTLIPTFCISD